MSIFAGLKQEQIDNLTKEKCYVHVPGGQTIFKEGDAAFGLFIIVSGSVDIVLSTESEDIPITRLGPEIAFGEMGLISSAGLRTATVRAAEDTVLLGIPIGPGDMFSAIADTQTSIQLLQNLICLLGERLRSVSSIRTRTGSTPVLISDLHGRSTEKALQILQSSEVASEFLTQSGTKKRFQTGDYVFHQGDESNGFYLVHSGVLEVVDEAEGTEPRVLTRVHTPNVIGEIGFFSGGTRLASCRVAEPIECTYFSGSDFEKLRQKDAEKALAIMFAAAQLTIQLIIDRQIRMFSGY
jgi:CRP-like cAMP-binding protein